MILISVDPVDNVFESGAKQSPPRGQKRKTHPQEILVYLRNVSVSIFANIGNQDKCDLVLGELGCGSRTRWSRAREVRYPFEVKLPKLENDVP